jgi:hypothetical protein
MESIVNLALRVAAITTGMILGLFILGRAKRPVDSRAALVGLVTGFAAILSLCLPELWRSPIVAWPWYAPVGTLVTVGAALAVNQIISDRRTA